MSNAGKKTNFPAAIEAGKGCAAPVKFYYKAGTRVWFEFPLFRLAETYLNLAEAYNEKGIAAKALENLNKVHNRAGLPKVTGCPAQDYPPGACHRAVPREQPVL